MEFILIIKTRSSTIADNHEILEHCTTVLQFHTKMWSLVVTVQY